MLLYKKRNCYINSTVNHAAETEFVHASLGQKDKIEKHPDNTKPGHVEDAEQ